MIQHLAPACRGQCTSSLLSEWIPLAWHGSLLLGMDPSCLEWILLAWNGSLLPRIDPTPLAGAELRIGLGSYWDWAVLAVCRIAASDEFSASGR